MVQGLKKAPEGGAVGEQGGRQVEAPSLRAPEKDQANGVDFLLG